MLAPLLALALLADAVPTPDLPAPGLPAPARFAKAAVSWPKLSGWVVDEEGLFTPQEAAALDAVARRLDAAGRAQLAIAGLGDLRGLERKEAAVALFAAWGLGHSKQRSDGLLVLVARTPEGKIGLKVEVGYGLEGDLPDGKVGALMDSAAGPLLREKRVGAGVLALSRALSAALGVQPPDLPADLGSAQQASAPVPGQRPTGTAAEARLAWLDLLGTAALLFVFFVQVLRPPWSVYRLRKEEFEDFYGKSPKPRPRTPPDTLPVFAVSARRWWRWRCFLLWLAAVALQGVLVRYAALVFVRDLPGFLPPGGVAIFFVFALAGLLAGVVLLLVIQFDREPLCAKHGLFLRPTGVRTLVSLRAEVLRCPAEGCRAEVKSGDYLPRALRQRYGWTGSSGDGGWSSSSDSGGGWSGGGGSDSPSTGGGASGGGGADREY
jgi:uncharacterized membrane protein YgcG